MNQGYGVSIVNRTPKLNHFTPNVGSRAPNSPKKYTPISARMAGKPINGNYQKQNHFNQR